MANFSVSARTLIHLGAELITSDEIAIYELIKNSFDAGSKRVKINFFIALPIRNIEKVRSILNDSKNRFNKRRDNAVVYLNDIFESDCIAGAEEYYADIINELSNVVDVDEANSIVDEINYIEVADTGCGMSRNDLENVFLRIGTDSKLNKTNVGSSKRHILGNKGIGRLAMMRLGKKAEVFSWVKESKGAYAIYFDWDEFLNPKQSINEIELPIEKWGKPAESDSGTRIKISALEEDWSEASLQEGLVECFLRRLRNPFQERSIRFPIDVHFNNRDRIKVRKLDEQLWALADYHLVMEMDPIKLKRGSDAAIKLVINNVKKDDKKYVDTRTVSDVQSKTNLLLNDLKDIGPIKLVIRWYNRKNLAGMRLGSELNIVRKELNKWCGGIAIYRDGFRVGMTGSDKDGDWFGLDAKALKRGGFFVNSIQTIGALEISAIRNPKLVDRSNREGLIENKITKDLVEIISAFAIERLREHIQQEGENEKKKELSNIAEEGTEHIEEKVAKAAKNLSAIRQEVPKELKKEVAEIDESLHYISTHVKKFNDALVMVREQRENILELAGVGTVMNSVLHELTRSTTQTRTLLERISRKSDGTTKDLLMKLEAEVKSINTRLRQLDPLSTSGRQRRVKFDANKLMKTILDGYSSRFSRHDIEVVMTVDGMSSDEPVSVKMVRGFFCLAIENLISNSVFWLQDRLMPGATQRQLFIDIDSKASVVSVSDTGAGVSPSDKTKIFEPGFSLKKGGKGFGLYIAREVAFHHNSNIYLDDAPDKDGRLRMFSFELPRD